MKRIALVAVLTTLVGCTSISNRSPLSPSSVASVSSSQHVSWTCFTNPESCGLAGASVISAGAPLAAGPLNLAATVAGSTVTVAWQPPAGVAPTGYILEAGSRAGASDIAFFMLNSPATSLTVSGVPSNVYHVRVRAILNNCCGTEPSNEIVVTVGTPSSCTPLVSPTNTRARAAGDSITIFVMATCAWTAITNSPFLTITSGSVGSGNGTVTVSVAPNGGGNRIGVVTIAGQAVVVTQDTANLAVSFSMFDTATQAAATTECRIRNNPSTCELRSTSFPFGRNTIVSYTWTIQYTYGTTKNITTTEPNGALSFSDVCGGPGSTAQGTLQPLSVTLVVTDNTGESGSAVSGQGNQNQLFVRLFTCGS
jgi:hypothetical protein